MVNSPQGTEEKILEAAKRVFHRKGFEGARMQEIADEAGINKALVHYYFRNKSNLFEAVFQAAFSRLMGQAKEVFFSDKPLQEKIKAFLSNYLDVLSENSYIPWFILNGIYERPDQLQSILEKSGINPSEVVEKLRAQLQEEYGQGINPFHVWLNVLSLCIFPVVAKPLIRQLFQLPEETYQHILEQRKTEVPRFISNALNGYKNSEKQNTSFNEEKS